MMMRVMLAVLVSAEASEVDVMHSEVNRDAAGRRPGEKPEHDQLLTDHSHAACVCAVDHFHFITHDVPGFVFHALSELLLSW